MTHFPLQQYKPIYHSISQWMVALMDEITSNHETRSVLIISLMPFTTATPPPPPPPPGKTDAYAKPTPRWRAGEHTHSSARGGQHPARRAGQLRGTGAREEDVLHASQWRVPLRGTQGYGRGCTDRELRDDRGGEPLFCCCCVSCFCFFPIFFSYFFFLVYFEVYIYILFLGQLPQKA